MRYDILYIYSALDPEYTWTEVAHAWVFVVKSIGIRGSSLVFTNLSLMNFTADTLKVSHAPTKMDFMWRGKSFVVPYFRIHAEFNPF